MKHFALLALLLTLAGQFLSPLSAQAQPLSTTQPQARVVDAVTGEPLPFAQVYVSPECGTMSNDDGYFWLSIPAQQPLRITYVGYEPLHTVWDAQQAVYRLQPSITSLHTVEVFAKEDILNKVLARLKRDFKKNKDRRANFFFRQTTQATGRTEMAEAFVQASSAVNVRQIDFLNARRLRQTLYATNQSNIDFDNLLPLVGLGPMMEDVEAFELVKRPFHVNRHKKKESRASSFIISSSSGHSGTSSIGYSTVHWTEPDVLEAYKVSIATQRSQADTSRVIFKINLTYNYDDGPHIQGTMYVNAADYTLLSFEGELCQMTLDMGVDYHVKSEQAATQVNVLYTQQNGFTEVQNVVASVEAGNVYTRSLLYNMGGQPLPFDPPKKKKRKANATFKNTVKLMQEAGYDSTLWQHQVVRRTQHEQELAHFASLSPQEQARWISAHTDTAFTHTGPFRPLLTRLHKFARTLPQEKVYVHMDNTSYMLGDTVWFKAYLRQTNTDAPSTVSGLLYAELWSHEGYMLQRKEIFMQGGSGMGFFELNRNLMYAGFYELRAYTRWQLNWGCHQHPHSNAISLLFPNKEFEQRYYRDYDKLYSRTFPVYDAPQAPGTWDHSMTLRAPRRTFKDDPDKPSLRLHLFPEGGAMVEGVPQRVAFEAAWNNGQWVEGHLYVDNDSFPAQNRGRGVFSFTPGGKMPRIRFRTTSGEQVEASLPDAQPQGGVISVERQGNKWRIHTTLSPNLAPEHYALSLIHQGRVERVHLDVGQPLDIPVDSLPAGVHQATLFDTQGQVLADRLFFSYSTAHLSPTLHISGLKNHYQPYEPISLTLQAPSKMSDISIAVRDAHRLDTPFDNGSIFTEMLLASEIKGFVPNPGYYFEASDQAHLQALDLLMLTQGWRRFEWRHMAVPGTWDLTQPDEKAPILTGKVYSHRTYDYASPTDETLNPRDMQHDLTYLAGGYRHDCLDYMSPLKSKTQREVLIHSELVALTDNGGDYLDVGNIYMHETPTLAHKFRIQLPRRFEPSILFLDASDTTKWTKKNKYTWVQQVMSDDEYHRLGSFKNRVKFYVEPAECYVVVDFPYPRFVRPYTFHQTQLMHTGHTPDATASHLLSDGTRVLQQVTVRGTRNMMRRFSDEYPFLMVDAYEARNMQHDSGLTFARCLLGDYGLDYIHLNSVDKGITNNITTYPGMSETRRKLAGLSTHPDSMYFRSQLKAFRHTQSGTAVGPNDDVVGDPLERQDKYVFYSDYSPRLAGSRRYWGTNLPESEVVIYDYPGEKRTPVYRNRRFLLPGFAACGQFYSPDYSLRTPDAEHPDYRRTLYWNPDVRLDDQGKAQLKFYNNSRTTQIAVDAAGQTATGTMLWNKQHE